MRWVGARHAVFVVAATSTLVAGAEAQGHGPVYGLSTPTLGRGGWSLDVAGMGRLLDGGAMAMIRPMLSYGVTEDLQLSTSVPISLKRDPELPGVRAFTRMPASRDVEVMVGWRFQRRGTGVGARQETTLWVAADIPTDGRRGGFKTAPSFFGSLVTGYASRDVYFWVGGAFERSLSAGPGAHRAGDVSMASIVIGYRPATFRDDYPSPDWRGFLEVVGEVVERDQLGAADLSDTGGDQVYAGLTVLGLYGSWGVAGGPAFPLYQSLNGIQTEEGVRLALNLTFWF